MLNTPAESVMPRRVRKEFKEGERPIPFAARFPPALFGRLRNVSRRSGLTINLLIIRAVEEFLDREEKPD